jgi:predicted acylesterase/phospholipase RssA
MKGGITSGVVYPAAVMVLKDKYRFRSIGGASAGAIAAALTAAAEFGREDSGFQRLQAVREEIQGTAFLRDLFRERGPTRPLLTALVSLTSFRSVAAKLGAALWLIPRWVAPAFIVSAITGAIACLLAIWWFATIFGSPLSLRELFAQKTTATVVLAGIAAVLSGYIGALLRAASILLCHVPRRGFFGLCSGFMHGNERVLSGWLHARIESVAGGKREGRPLTFADLANKAPPSGSQAQGEDWRINLKVMTSNLSHGQPYVFPRPEHESMFVFNEEEFRKLFPAGVVDYMAGYRPPEVSPDKKSIPLARGFHFLPPGPQLPVLVATRMSLSFPVLLSAVPLYTINPQAFALYREGRITEFGPEQLQRNWFSDGGISSNFPIHFFDSFLPSRPTFGMNLNYLGVDFKPAKQSHVKAGAFSETNADVATAEERDVAEPLPEVILPPLRMRRYARPHWQPIESLGSFLGAIFSTAQNYRDNMQMMLPSYRDRIVQIWLRADEGGMNLSMPAETIRRIDEKGVQAGECLRDQMNFREHQWVRLRVLTAALETQLRKMRMNFPDSEHYRALLQDQLDAKSWFKSADPAWCASAEKRLDLLVEILNRWNELDPTFGHPDAESDPAFFAVNAPVPRGVLRVTPDV